MRDIFRFFNQTYSAVRTNDRGDRNRGRCPNDWAENGNPYMPTVVEPDCDQDQYRCNNMKSAGGRSVDAGFSILDMFFKPPNKGKGPRWPKGECFFSLDIFFIYLNL